MFDLATTCWFLTGPTAAGKTQVGLELAERLGAEIVSMDSMALYRGMDIGTAKPNWRQRARVAHHMLDVINPDQQYTLSDYVDATQAVVQDIMSRGRAVLFIGGTPLYLKSLLRGIFSGPPADWEFRHQVDEEVRRVGTEALHRRLMQVDPLAAARLHPNNTRRIIRALEVYKLTGQPISHLQVQFDEGREAELCKVFVLRWPRAVLHQRIERRVDQMFSTGLVEEVRGLLKRYGQLSRTASQAVGYREAIRLVNGHGGLDETIQRVKTRTRRFARRQETWFRSLNECRDVAIEDPLDPAHIARQIHSAVMSDQKD